MGGFKKMSFNQNLQQELTQWENEGLVTPEAAAQLRKRYPVTKRSMTQTLALLGSVFLGIGVILFFAAHWQSMTQVLKVCLVILSFTFAFGFGTYFKDIKKNYPKVGYALICLGSLLFGASIWLIAQIFHLEAQAGIGFFLWYLGVIPVAYLYASTFNLSLALINLVAWFLAGSYPLGWAFIIYPVLLLGTILPLTIMKKDRLNFTACVIALYIWFIPLGVKLAHVQFSFHLGILSLMLFSLILYQAVQVLKSKGFFAENFLLALSIVGLFASMAPFTFHDFLFRFTNKISVGHFSYLVIAALLILFLLKLKEKTFQQRDIPLMLLYLLIFLYYPTLRENSLLLIANNVFFFLFTLFSIYYSYTLKRPLLFNLSMLMFAAAVAMKYFDFFFALMDRSLFFMSGGVLLLLGSFFLEYKRRNLLKSMETEGLINDAK